MSEPSAADAAGPRSPGGRGRRREGRSRGDGLRTCVGCGEASGPDGLIRILPGPDGRAAVDLRGKGPGRGCWLHPRARCFREAAKKKKVGRALRVEGLVTDGEELLRQAGALCLHRCAHLLSLSQKAGQAASGAETVQRSLRAGGMALLLVAADASDQTLDRALAWGHGFSVAVYQTPLTVDDLGQLLGKAPRAVVALRAGELARAVEVELNRAIALEAGARRLSPGLR